MRRIGFLLVPVGMMIAGCPPMGGAGDGLEGVLEGEWNATDETGKEFGFEFNAQGQLIEVSGADATGQSVSIDIANAVSEVSGSDVLITIPADGADVLYEGTLSADENTLTGTISRTIELGVNAELTITQGALTAVRDDGGGDGGDLPQNVVALFTATMDGDQETPPVTTDGSGSGSVGITADNELVIQFTVMGLSGPATLAHIHNAALGVAGDVVLNLTESIVEENGVVTINVTVTDADFTIPGALDLLVLRSLYFNVHTAAHPGGEVRGQLLATDDVG